jgi:hypothetical protein
MTHNKDYFELWPWLWCMHPEALSISERVNNRKIGNCLDEVGRLFRRVSARVRAGTAGQSPPWDLPARPHRRHPYLSWNKFAANNFNRWLIFKWGERLTYQDLWNVDFPLSFQLVLSLINDIPNILRYPFYFPLLGSFPADRSRLYLYGTYQNPEAIF